MLYASSANFGSWPVAVSVAVVTSDGGRISSNAIDVAIERVLAQRPRQRSTIAALHREHRAADLGGALVVEDAERRARSPSAARADAQETPPARPTGPFTSGLSASLGAVGRIGMRQVGDAQQHVAQIALDDLELVGQHPLVIAERTAAQLQLLGTMRVAGATQLTDSLRQIVDLGPNCIALGDDVAGQRVEGDRPLQLVEHVALATPGQGSADRIGVVTQQTDIDHRSERLPVLSASRA